jgi:hypothetical protein
MVTEKNWPFFENSDESKIRLRKSTEWLYIGSHVLDGVKIDFAKELDCIVNVSCNANYMFQKKPKEIIEYFWHPICELSNWGYSPFFWSAKVLEYAENKNKKTLLHCDAGTNRSVCIAIGYFLFKGNSLPDSSVIVAGGNESLGKLYCEKFENNQKRGHIPKDISEFFKIQEATNYSIEGVLNVMEKRREK